MDSEQHRDLTPDEVSECEAREDRQRWEAARAPAFPCTGKRPDPFGFGSLVDFTQPGMTKREVIAMHALQGITAGAYCGGGFMEVHVKYAVEYADALLAELERTKKT